MNAFLEAMAVWLADFHLLGGALLAATLAILAGSRQPARRMAAEKAALAGLGLLALLCAVPGWSLVHLSAKAAPQPMTAPGSTPTSAAAVAELAPPIKDNILQNEAPAPASTPQSTAATPTAASKRSIPGASAISFLHAAGSLGVILWLVAGAVLASRLQRGGRPAPPELAAALQSLVGAAAPPRLLVGAATSTPLALGLRRPAILLPAGAAELPPRELSAILAHEWAHVAAGDLRTLALSRVLLVLLWPQPLYWLLRRQIRLDQETLADAAAAEVAGRVGYAEQLLGWARTAPPRVSRLAGAVGLWEGPSQLKRRIAALLDERLVVLRRCTKRWSYLCVVWIAGCALLLSLVTLQAAELESLLIDVPGMFQRNHARTGYVPGVSAVNEPRVAWKFNTGELRGEGLAYAGSAGTLGEPLCLDGVVYFGDSLGRLVAMTAAEKRVLWLRQLTGSARGQAPVVNGDDIIFALEAGVMAVNRATGETSWTYEIAHGGAGECSPLLIDDELFVAGYDGQLHALNAATGKVRWTCNLLDGASDVSRGEKGDQARLDKTLARPRTPASDGKLIFQPVFDQSRLVAVERTTGEITWWSKLGGWIYANPAVANGCVFFGAQDGEFRCVNSRTGEVVWKFQAEGRIEAGAAVHGDSVYFGCCAGCVYSLDVATGELRWKFPLDKANGRSPVYCAPLVADDAVYIAGMEGQVYALDSQRGTLRWKLRPSRDSEIDSNLSFDGRRFVMTTRVSVEDKGEDAVVALDSPPLEAAANGVASDAFAPEAGAQADSPTFNLVAAADDAADQAPDWAKPEPNVVKGRVLDEQEKPLAGAEITLYRTTLGGADDGLTEVAAQTSDVDGNFRFEDVVDVAREFPRGLPDERFHETPTPVIVVVGRGEGRAPAWGNVPVVSAAQRGEVQVHLLKPAATLRGRVTSRDGRPVAGAEVVAGMSSPPGSGLNAERTNADGRYEIADLAAYDAVEARRQFDEMMSAQPTDPRAYYFQGREFPLVVRHPAFAAKRVAVEAVPGELDVQLEPAAVIEGVAVYRDRDGREAPAAGVIIRLLRNTPADQQQFGLFEATATKTDDQGRYRFGSLPAGRYEISAVTRGWVTVGLKDIEAFESQSTATPQLVLTRGGVLQVELVDAETRKPLELPAGQRGWINPVPHNPLPTNIVQFTNGVGELQLPPGNYADFIVHIPGAAPQDVGWVSANFEKPQTIPSEPIAEGETRRVQILMKKQATQTTALFLPAAEPADDDGANSSRDSSSADDFVPAAVPANVQP